MSRLSDDIRQRTSKCRPTFLKDLDRRVDRFLLFLRQVTPPPPRTHLCTRLPCHYNVKIIQLKHYVKCESGTPPGVFALARSGEMPAPPASAHYGWNRS